MEKTIITIARQYGSGGKTIGKMLADQLHIPCYGREIISMASEDSGINEKLFADEKLKTAFFQRVFGGGYKGDIIVAPESAGFTKNDNLHNYQVKIIRQLAEQGSCVIIGRCADYILQNDPHVTRVFVHASADFCLREAMKVNSLPEAEVLRLIEKTDDYRAKFYKYYTGHEWMDARNYDLSLNSSKLGFAGTVDAILAYIEVKNKHKS